MQVRQGDGQPHLVAVHPDAALFALFLQFLERRDQRLEQLHDDGRRNVRVDAHRGDREILERPAGKDIQELGQLVGCQRLLKLLERSRVDVGYWNVRDQPEDQ